MPPWVQGPSCLTYLTSLFLRLFCLPLSFSSPVLGMLVHAQVMCSDHRDLLPVPGFTLPWVFSCFSSSQTSPFTPQFLYILKSHPRFKGSSQVLHLSLLRSQPSQNVSSETSLGRSLPVLLNLGCVFESPGKLFWNPRLPAAHPPQTN